MSQPQKRKRPESNIPSSGLSQSDQKVLTTIKSKKSSAISKHNIQKATNLPTPVLNKCLETLQSLTLIKEIVHVKFNGKHYISTEYKPSDEISGGVWYADGKLDAEFIQQIKKLCFKIIEKLKVATSAGVYDFLKTKKLVNIECTSEQISEVLQLMVLENMIIEVKSSGLGEYHLIPIGDLCYRLQVEEVNQGPKMGAMASIPCGVCPRIAQCTPDGLISPTNCAYFTKWLDF